MNLTANNSPIDLLLVEDDPGDVVMTREALSAAKVLQLCFAVYQASEIGGPVDPRTMTGPVTPTGWADW